MAEIDTSTWTKKAVIGLNEQGQVQCVFRLDEGEIMTPRQINFYKRALIAQYYRHVRDARVKRRMAAKSEQSSKTT